MLNGLGVSYHKKMLFSLIAPLLQVDQDRKRSSALRFADVENQSVGGIYYNITRYLKHKPVSTGQCPQLFLWPPNFVVFRKICFKHIIWTKILSPKNVFCPPPKPWNLATGLLKQRVLCSHRTRTGQNDCPFEPMLSLPQKSLRHFSIFSRSGSHII